MLDKNSPQFKRARRQVARTQAVTAPPQPAKSNRPTIPFVMSLCQAALGNARKATDQDRPFDLGINIMEYKTSTEDEYFPSGVGYDVSTLNYPVLSCARLGPHIRESLRVANILPIPPNR